MQDKKYALDFKGGCLNVGLHPDFNLDKEMTFAAWIRPESGTGLQATILSKHYTAYEPQIQNNHLVFERGPEYSSQRTIEQNTWVHVVVSYNATLAKDNLAFFINGQLDKTYDLTAPLVQTNEPLIIGARPPFSLPFSGQMAGVALWNRAHNAWQVQQNFNNLDETASDLVAYWSMEEGTGTQVKDVSVNHHHATINNAAQVTWQSIDGAQVQASCRSVSGKLVSPAQRRRNTTVQRMDQLLNDPNDSLEESHRPLPSSGRNGEATKLLNRVRTYQRNIITEQQQKNNQRIQIAKADKASQLKQAHTEATKTLNSARFDSIWFIYKGRIHQCDAQYNMSEFHVGNVTHTQKSVPANQLWFDTGVDIAQGETVKINYTGGRWNISPQDRNLTGVGTTRFNGLPNYALPGKPAGSLVARVGGGHVFYIGNSSELPVGQSGRLFLTTNDDVGGQYGNGYHDNSGSINVDIALVKKAISVEASDLMLDQSRGLVFWSQSTVPFSLHVAKLDGSEHKTLVEHPDTPATSVALDELNQYVYHIAGTGNIMRVKYDGSGHESILDISGPAKDHYWQLEIDPDGKKMYWTNDYSIWRANLDGSNAELIVSNHEAPFPIDLAINGQAKKLYWVDKELEVVRRSNLDGSDAEDLYGAKNPVRGLMLDYVTPDTANELKQEVYWVTREETLHAQTPGIVGYWPLSLVSDNSQSAQQSDYISNAINPFGNILRELEQSNDDLPLNLSAAHYAFNFTGKDFAKVPNHLVDDLRGNSFTISMWIKPSSVPAQGDAGLLAGTNYHSNKCLHLVLRSTKAYLGFYGNDISGKTTIKPNEWTYLSFRYDVNKQEQAIFVNGVLDNSASGHAPLNNDPESLTLLGRYSNSPFSGLIAGLQIVTQALSDDAIKATMSERNPTTVMDSIIAGPAWSRETLPPTITPHSSVLAFNGISTYVKMGAAKDLGLCKQSFTVECWLQTDSERNEDLSILGTTKAAPNQGLHLTLRGRKPYMGFYNNDLGGQTTIDAGQWYHIAWRFDISTMEQSLFVNGKKEASRTAVGAFEGEGMVFLGRCFEGRIFSGFLSELRIWKIARSDSDIANNYRHYRESFALRGPVDASLPSEYLFEIPAEGGLNLVSKQKKEYEERLLAVRKRKENQAKAAVQITHAHEEKTSKVNAKQAELTQAQQQADARINQKKAAHDNDRKENRAKLLQAQNDKSLKINNARTSANRTVQNAEQQAQSIKSKANTEATNMKNAARENRSRAEAARNKNRR